MAVPESSSDLGGLWDGALAAARRGDAALAREHCARASGQREPFPRAHDFLLGRCLAEAGVDLDESIALLERVIADNPANVLAPQTLALALLRSGAEKRAAELFRVHRLPHDNELLGQVALCLEMTMRPWPRSLPPDWPEWPKGLAGRPSDGSDKSDKSDKSDLSDSSDSSEAASTAPKKRPRSIATLMAEWEKLLMKGRAVEIARGVVAALAGGLDDPEIHFIGGLVAEDVGDEPRARAHLARALIMEPSMLMARTALGRVYWRSGRLEAATDLIRSLPVEGPEDYGRHYHLALAHESAGDRAAALEAMHLALRDFFIETFDFHIRRIFDGWLRRVAAASEATA